jgi:hypothetical protein
MGRANATESNDLPNQHTELQAKRSFIDRVEIGSDSNAKALNRSAPGWKLERSGRLDSPDSQRANDAIDHQAIVIC